MELWKTYTECPCCGTPCDDGTILAYKGRTHLICFECSESRTEQEIVKFLDINCTT